MRKNRTLSLSISLMAVSIWLISCRKDPIICEESKEITDRSHTADLSLLNGAPEFLDSLKKHPQLQVYRIINSEHSITMHCHIYYNDLEILTNNYLLSKSKKDNWIYADAHIPDKINISLTPSVSSERAISIARSNLDFSRTCITYKLGIYDLNASQGYMPKKYILVWIVKGEARYPYVIVDANTETVHRMDGGVRM